MTKQELIDEITTRVSMETGISKTTSKRVLDALAEVAKDELAKGNEVPLPGIGKLTVADKPARKGRNPKTGAEIDIPAKRVPWNDWFGVTLDDATEN